MQTPHWVTKGLHLTHKTKKNGVPEQEPVAYTWHPYEDKTCSYCDRTVWQENFYCKKSFNPIPHWRVKCNNCKCFLNRDTGKFDLDPAIANNKIVSRLRDK